jgi:hypothetical protein
MSSSRANASAIQRRTNNPSPAKQPVTNTRYQQQHQPVQNPKLSVSDAIALTTIRLSKVETFINNLPPLDQLEAYSNQQQQSNCMITENVFNSIVSRLDKLEKSDIKINEDKIKEIIASYIKPEIQTIKDELNALNTEFQRTKENTELNALNTEFQRTKDDLKKEYSKLNELNTDFQHTKEDLKKENAELKNMILILQNYTLQTNQKLSDIIFHQDNIEEEKELSEHIHNLLNIELNSEENETISVLNTNDIEEEEEEPNNDLNINI